MVGLLIDSGNIVDLLKSNGVTTVSDELTKVVVNGLAKGPTKCRSARGGHLLYNHGRTDPVIQHEASGTGELEVTLKLYVLDKTLGSADIIDAFRQCYDRMGVKCVDMTLLAANVQTIQNQSEAIGSEFFDLWDSLVQMKEEQLTKVVGVSDLSATQLKSLEGKVRELPTVDQVNLSDCCVIPTDLVRHAEDKSIQLLAHQDPRDPWTGGDMDAAVVDALQRLREDAIEDAPTEPRPRWIGRYQALEMSHAVVSHVGYVVLLG